MTKKKQAKPITPTKIPASVQLQETLKNSLECKKPSLTTIERSMLNDGVNGLSTLISDLDKEHIVDKKEILKGIVLSQIEAFGLMEEIEKNFQELMMNAYDEGLVMSDTYDRESREHYRDELLEKAKFISILWVSS